QDMNEVVGSDFVFLCYSLNFSSAVKSIGAMNTDNAANKCQTNATKLNGNMNKGATAKLGMAEATEIYLCYDYASAYDAWNGHSAFEALKAVKFDSEPNGNSVCASLGSAWAPVAWDYLTPISGSGGAVQNASANGVSANMNYGAAKGNAWGKFIYICGYEIQVPGSR
ncbi:MAG: hypothetical protein NTZ05_23450, partial [Chloroflexi bacterium]|nr:hypothetical protein [Chloroflexota bacterium]